MTIIPAQVNPSFPFWKGPLPHKYTPEWVTYVRESLGGVTGVGGDPNQVPSVGEFNFVIVVKIPHPDLGVNLKFKL